MGYTPQLSTAVWVGRPEGDTPMRNVHGINVTGGSFPARIFSRYMRAALAGVPVQNLYTASPDDLGLRFAVTTSVPPPPPTFEVTTTTAPYVPFPTTTTTVPPTTVAPIPTTLFPTTTTVPRFPTTTPGGVAPTTTTPRIQ